jgi:CheY-like chemotaxis protein
VVKRKRLLLVEDNPVVLQTLTLILEKNSYIVGRAGGLEEALMAANELHPEILLCDVFLPDGIGLDFAGKLCEQWPDCRVFLISGQPETAALLEEAEKKNCYFKVLAKPIAPLQLLKELASVRAD